MRTVHETEALRPSDPVPKHHSSNPQNRQQRLRITMNKGKENGEPTKEPTPTSPTNTGQPDDDPNDVYYTRDPDTGRWAPNFPLDVQFSAEDLSLPAKDLATLLEYQVEWASESAEQLKDEEEMWNEKREAEAIVKNLVLREFMTFSESLLGPIETPEPAESDTQPMGDGPPIKYEILPPFPYSVAEASNHMEVEGVNGSE
jgi:hypothetical protein